MLIWTGLGWLGIVVTAVPLIGTPILANKFPLYRPWLFLGGWAINVIACVIVGKLLAPRDSDKLLVEPQPGEQPPKHTLNGMRVEWTWTMATPVYILFYFILK
jgi:hypothetical protein